MDTKGRINVKLTPESHAALSRVAERLGTTRTGALAFGLNLLAAAVREGDAGNSLGVVKGERVVKELVGPWSAAS